MCTEDFYNFQAVNYSSEQLNYYTPNDEQFVNNQAAQHADNNTVAEFPQHYPAEYHVKEGYQNECFVHSKETDGQTNQYFDDTLNRQEHQNQYGLNSTAAYAYDVDFNSQNLTFNPMTYFYKTVNNNLHFSDKIDVPNFSEPQGQCVEYNMSSNYFTTASQEYDLSKAIFPISKKNVQKSKAPSITAKKSFPDGAYQYSRSEIKKILSLPITLEGKIVPKNLLERIVYELRARNIHKQKFAKNVLGRPTQVFYDMSRSSEDWDKLKRIRRKQYEKMKEWLDMSEDEKNAAVERESNYEKILTVFTREQRGALERHFEKFPEARKSELVGLADQLQLPSKVVATYFIRQRVKRKNQRDQQQ